MTKEYRVIREFEADRTWYGQYLGSGGKVKVGDVFELYAEPTPQKKLYRLVKQGKFPVYLQIRPNDFKNYFEEVVEEDA